MKSKKGILDLIKDNADLFLTPYKFIESNHNDTPIRYICRWTAKTEYDIELEYLTDKEIEMDVYTSLLQLFDSGSSPIEPTTHYVKEVMNFYKSNRNLYIKTEVYYVSEENQGTEGNPIFSFRVYPKIEARDTRSEMTYWPKCLELISDPIAFGAWVWTIFSLEKCRQVLYLQGNGNDGKSTVSAVIGNILGNRFTSGADILDLSQSANHNLTKFIGKRLIIAADVGENTRITDLANLKKITGGDLIEINPKGKDAFSTFIDAKIMMTSNFAPVLTKDAYSLTRILWLQFDNFADRWGYVPDLKPKLLNEGYEFLAFCKFCHQQRFDGQLISSLDSSSRVNRQIEIILEEKNDEFNNLFDIDADQDWWMSRHDIYETVRKNRGFKPLGEKDKLAIKRYLQENNLKDVESPKWYRKGGISGCRGIRVKEETNLINLFTMNK